MRERRLYLQIALLVCGLIALQSIADPSEHGHLAGDVPALLLAAAVLAALTPRFAASRPR